MVAQDRVGIVSYQTAADYITEQSSMDLLWYCHDLYDCLQVQSCLADKGFRLVFEHVLTSCQLAGLYAAALYAVPERMRLLCQGWLLAAHQHRRLQLQCSS